MPLKSGALTPQEKAFIESYVVVCDAQEAAKEAGYAQPRSQGYQVLQRPHIQSEITKIQQERIANTLLPLAVNAIERLLISEKTPAGAVVQAAKLVMDRVLGESGADSKEPHEMTGDELANALAKLRQEAANRAKPVIEHEPAPNVLD